MWSVFLPAGLADDDDLALELWERGTAGIIEEADGLRAFFEDEIESETIAHLWPNAEFRREPKTSVLSADQQDCDIIFVGERFCIAPPACLTELPSDRLHLRIEAATAFGSGRHETTQLCLEALEQYVRPGFVVLDIGAGSGILSRAASMLGARQVFSCDIHQEARAAADVQGSADAFASGRADLVLANITASVVDALAFELRRIAKPQGLIVVSGFIRDKPPQCFAPRTVLVKEDWLCWICRPEDITPFPQPPEGLLHKADWWL